jgi:predicted RNase H-like HicB family nuclease
MKTIEEYLALNYRATVQQDEDGDYIVRVDDLPGCVTHGSTPDEAFKNLEEAKRAWMESRIAVGLEIPEPRDVEEYSGRVLLRMPKFLHRRLAVQARDEGTSLNQYLVSLLSDASARENIDLRQSGVWVPMLGSSQWGLNAMNYVNAGWSEFYTPMGTCSMRYQNGMNYTMAANWLGARSQDPMRRHEALTTGQRPLGGVLDGLEESTTQEVTGEKGITISRNCPNGA